MNLRIRHLAWSFCAAVALSMAAPPSFAQGYPNKPVRLIVPYAAGGGTDFFARTVGSRIQEQLGQVIVIENKPGASTIIGAEAAAKSPPDGYTVLVADSTTLAVNPHLYKKLAYDSVKDFSPVTLTARFALLLVVNPSVSNATSAQEFIESARKEPGKINYASVGTGTSHHLAMELFQQRTGIKVNHIPYKGAGPAIQDVAGGQVPVMFVDLAAGSPMIKAGKLKVLGVASAKRIAALPDVPTLTEQGIENFEAWAWQGLVVPAGTPNDVVERLKIEYAKAVTDPTIRQKLVDAGVDPVTSTPAEMARYVQSESVKWADVIKRGDIKIE